MRVLKTFVARFLVSSSSFFVCFKLELYHRKRFHFQVTFHAKNVFKNTLPAATKKETRREK